MSPSWYTDIDAWFDKYGFEEDVMYALFKHCYDYRGLSRQYITRWPTTGTAKTSGTASTLTNTPWKPRKSRTYAA